MINNKGFTDAISIESPKVAFKLEFDDEVISSDNLLVEATLELICNSFIGQLPTWKLSAGWLVVDDPKSYENRTFNVFVGAYPKVNGEYSDEPIWVSMGIYTIPAGEQKTDVVNPRIDIVAYDSSISLDEKYEPLNFGTEGLTGKAIRDQIAARNGLSFKPTTLKFDTRIFRSLNLSAGQGITDREVLKQYLILNMAMASVDKDGLLQLVDVTQNNPVETLSNFDYPELKLEAVFGPINSIIYSNKATGDDRAYQSVEAKDEESIDINGKNSLEFQNNIFIESLSLNEKQSLVNELLNLINGYSYTPFDMDLFARPDLDVGDTITLMDMKGNESQSIITSMKIEYNGGLIGSLSTKIIPQNLPQKNIPTIFERLDNAEISVDRINNKIALEVTRTDELEEKYAGIEIEVESINTKVNSINENTNIIPLLNGSEVINIDDHGQSSYPFWHFIQDGLFPSNDLYPGADVYPADSDSPIMWQEKVKGTLSEFSITFDTRGTAITPEGYVVPDVIHSYKGKRMQGDQRFRLWIREYTNRDVEYNSAHTRRLLLDATEGNQYESASIQLYATTQAIRLEYEIFDYDKLTLADQMFNRGQPKDYIESASDVKLQAEAQIKVLDGEIKSTVKEIIIVDGKVKENSSLIQQNADSILQKADKIELQGLVKITDLSNSGSTIINGDNIKTGKIDAQFINFNNAVGSNVKLSGEIIATSGILGNFSLINGVMNYTSPLYSRQYVYADLGVIKDIIMERRTRTSYDVFLYDFDGNGQIMSNDYMRLKKYLDGEIAKPKDPKIQSRVRMGTSSGQIMSQTLYNNGTVGLETVIQADTVKTGTIEALGLSLGGKSVEADSDGVLRLV